MFTRGSLDDVPTPGRKKPIKFESTPEWTMMKEALLGGIKPGEALQIQLTDSDLRKYDIKIKRTVIRSVKELVAALALKYEVAAYSFQRGGLFYVVVERPRAARRTA